MKKNGFNLAPVIFLWIYAQGFSYDMGLISAGVKSQKTLEFHYENGIKIAYTHNRLWSKRIQFGLSYVTNRLGSKIGATAEAQDYYHLCSGLYFRPGKYIDPFIQFNLGYYHYSINDDFNEETIGMDPEDFLDNNSPLADPVFGIRGSFFNTASVSFGAGYRLIQSADLLYPVYLNFEIMFFIFKGLKE